MQAQKWQVAERAAMEWLKNAWQHGQGGFPHSRWMFLPSSWAWKNDYAETTGYLMENLLLFNPGLVHGQENIALTAGNWLLRIQSKDGYYHRGTDFIKPSAFNTAQILFGLDVLYDHTQDERYARAISKSMHWLISDINPSGIFRKGLYKKNYFPAYYSRALWPMMKMDQKYAGGSHTEKLKKSLEYLFHYKNKHGFFNYTGFHPRRPALLHAVIYALEGFYECSVLLDRPDMKQYVTNILDRLCVMVHKHKTSPGFLYPDLSGIFSFVCVCGHAQLCALLLKVYRDTQNQLHRDTADFLFKQLLQWQIHFGGKEHRGAFPSSVPVWKNYFPFRCTNWTSKFFLDACFLMKKDSEIY